jgi:hypothetical protein
LLGFDTLLNHDRAIPNGRESFHLVVRKGAIEDGEPHAFASKLVDIGSLDDLVPTRTKILPSHIVDEDEENVWAFLLGGDSGLKNKGKDCPKRAEPPP